MFKSLSLVTVFLISILLLSWCGVSWSHDEAKRLNASALNKIDLWNYTGAINDLNKAIALDPKLEVAYYTRSAVKNRLKDYEGGIQSIDELIKLNPKNADAYSFRGIAKININQVDDGCKDLYRALDLGLDSDSNDIVSMLMGTYCK